MQDTRLSRRGLLAALGSLAVAPRLFAVGAKKLWDKSYELSVDVTIKTIEGFRVHRPYVAVWIEDEGGKSVRTLSLWVQTTRRGPRWIPDLRRWWRDDTARKEAGGVDLIPTVTSATRGAGKYNLVWDGKDDSGKYVEQGKYTLLIEAAREHGTYQLIRKDLDITNKAFKAALEGNEEIEGAAVEFRKRK